MNDLSAKYSVVRSSKRKTASIRISEKGVEVRVPSWVTDQWVNEWIASKRDWIERKREVLSQQLEATCLKVEPNALFPYRGRTFKLYWQVGDHKSVEFKHDILWVSINKRSKKAEEQRVTECLKQWYKVEAKEYLESRLNYWSGQMELNPNSLIVKDYKRRWGSCNRNGDISLNWRLIFAEDILIDYVIIHELSHLTHLNHGKSFWALVSEYCPDWAGCRAELQKCNGWVFW